MAGACAPISAILSTRVKTGIGSRGGQPQRKGAGWRMGEQVGALFLLHNQGFDQYNVKQYSWCEAPVRVIGCDGMWGVSVGYQGLFAVA